MTDKVQKIRKEVERMHKLLPSVIDSDNIYLDYADRICTTLEKFIDSLQEEPVSEDLEEAAHEYADLRQSNYETAFYAFMSGSKWQKAKDQETIELAEDHAMLAGMEKMKEQMMKDAVGGYVIEDIEEGNGDFLLSADYLPASMGLKDRQKVKVIIIKDE